MCAPDLVLNWRDVSNSILSPYDKPVPTVASPGMLQVPLEAEPMIKAAPSPPMKQIYISKDHMQIVSDTLLGNHLNIKYLTFVAIFLQNT